MILGKDVAVVNQMYAMREAQSALYPQLSLSGSYGYTLKKQRIYFDGMPGIGAMPGMEDGINGDTLQWTNHQWVLATCG